MTYYEILGVSAASSDEEIRQAYLHRIAELEMMELDTGVRDRQMSELRKAYSTLSNQTSRDIYFSLLNKEKRQKEKTGLEREALKGFGLAWLLTTLLGYAFLWTASWLFCLVYKSFDTGVACWLQTSSPYLVFVSRKTDLLDFWFSFGMLAMLGLIFVRVAFGILRRVYKRLGKDN